MGRQYKLLLDSYVGSLKEKYGLKTAEIKALYYLRRSGKNNAAKDIVAFLHMNKGYISSTMESLRQKGYVTAERDANDYRILRYSLTEAAGSLTAEIDEAIGRLYRTLFEGVSPEDREALTRTARQMARNIGEIQEETE